MELPKAVGKGGEQSLLHLILVVQHVFIQLSGIYVITRWLLFASEALFLVTFECHSSPSNRMR